MNRRAALMGSIVAGGGTLAALAMPRKPAAQTLKPLGEDLERIDPPAAVPDGVFTDASGAEHRLTEFKGRGMVVNLWATWCVPCVSEMPSLEVLSRALAPADIAVLPLSSDRGGADAVQGWFQQHNVTGLPVLLDPKGALARMFNARGIPTTIIINAKNQQVARLEGAADWGASDAQDLVRQLVG